MVEYDKVLQDRSFFENSGGGVTISGGECLAQPEFTIELAKKLFEQGVSVDIDTCGYVKQNIFERIAPYVDTFLYDVKAIDSEVHKKCTGRDNGLILDNLKCKRSCHRKIRRNYRNNRNRT